MLVSKMVVLREAWWAESMVVSMAEMKVVSKGASWVELKVATTAVLREAWWAESKDVL